MITKNVLDNVFDRSFSNGNFMGQLDKLDAMGMIDRRKMVLMDIKTLEACDKLEEKIEQLELRLNNLSDANKPKQEADRPIQPDNK